MKTINHTFTLATVMLAVAANVMAEEDKVTELTQPDSSISVGIGHVDGEREQFGIFDNLRNNKNILLFDADVNKRDDATGTWTTLKATNLGVDNRALEMGYERQGDWGISLDYSKIPYFAPYTVNSGITGLGTETQSVPVDGVTAYVPGTGTNINLSTERERIGLNYLKHLSPTLNFKVSFKNEEKKGDRHWGRGGAAEFAAEPIDSITRIMNATLNYAGEDFQMTGGYIGNWYQNQNGLVKTTDSTLGNPYYLSLPMDNQAHQAFLNGGYNITPTTRGTFRLSYTNATQNERLPTADVGAIAKSGTAPTNLDGVLNTTVVFLGLSSQPVKDLSIVANLRYHEVDEKTPAWFVIDTTTDAHSTPLDYRTLSGKLEGVYRLSEGYSLIAGIDIKNQNRSVPTGTLVVGVDQERFVPFRSKLNETTYRVQMRKSMSETVNGSIAVLQSKRDGSDYTEAVKSVPIGAVDPIHIADRLRNKLRATMDWAPSERTNLTFNLESSLDEYSGHSLGLRNGRAYLVSVDGSFHLNKDWQLTSWVSHDSTRAKQSNVQNNDLAQQMFDTLTDTGSSVGLGLEGIVSQKVKMGANLEWTRTNSEYKQELVGATCASDVTCPLPDIESSASKLSLFAEYAMANNAEIRFDVIYQRWQSNDWTWQFSDGTAFIYGATRDGTMVITDPDQASTFVSMRYKYKF